jgi:hypothetical protein
MKIRQVVLLSSLLWLWSLMVVAGETSHPETQSPAQGRLLTAEDILRMST